MHRLIAALALPLFVATSVAQTPAQRYRAAEKVWLSHRPDNLTWDDGTPEAASAIDAMWDAAIDSANGYIVMHPAASSGQVERAVMALDPMVNPSFGPPLQATVLKLQPGLYAISVTNHTASTVFVLHPQRKNPQVWRIDRAGDAPKDSHHLLKAWQSKNAADACRDSRPKDVYGTCGPVNGSIGALPPESSGVPRFYVDAVYSKDMGALVGKQTSIWRWEGDHAELVWIDVYDFSLDVDNGVHLRGDTLSIIEKRFPRTFSSCNGCFEPTTEQRLKIKPSAVEDLGKRPRIPELDLIDELFWRVGQGLPTDSIAAPQVALRLQKDILDIVAKSKPDDPLPSYFGMLLDWSLLRAKDGTHACVVLDGLDPLSFTVQGESREHARIIAETQLTDTSGKCPHIRN